jgi:hypothetical protein
MKERILRLCARGKIAINLRGMEYLQAMPGEDEETAWRRLRPKLSYTGRQLDEVFLLSPSAVPVTGGAAPGGPTVVSPTGDLFGDGTSPVRAPVDSPTPTGGLPTPGDGGGAEGGSIFGGSAPRARKNLANPPTSPLNLIGKLEGWGIGPATSVSEITIKVSSATGAQLRELLKKP